MHVMKSTGIPIKNLWLDPADENDKLENRVKNIRHCKEWTLSLPQMTPLNTTIWQSFVSLWIQGKYCESELSVASVLVFHA